VVVQPLWFRFASKRKWAHDPPAVPSFSLQIFPLANPVGIIAKIYPQQMLTLLHFQCYHTSPIPSLIQIREHNTFSYPDYSKHFFSGLSTTYLISKTLIKSGHFSVHNYPWLPIFLSMTSSPFPQPLWSVPWLPLRMLLLWLSSGTKHTFYLQAKRPTTVKEINKMISLRNVIRKMKLGYMIVWVWMCGVRALIFGVSSKDFIKEVIFQVSSDKKLLVTWRLLNVQRLSFLGKCKGCEAEMGLQRVGHNWVTELNWYFLIPSIS